MEQRNGYNKFLTVIIIIGIIAMLIVVGFFIFDLGEKYVLDKDAQEYIEDYEAQLQEDNQQDNQEENQENTDIEDSTVSSSGTKKKKSKKKTSSTKRTYTYKGFPTSGIIEIPKTKVKYPIITNMSKEAIEKAVAIEYGPGPNEPGNTVISGHNYRNGLFFSKNKKLNKGDIVYITDNSGTKVKYVIYNKYETSTYDTSYFTRDTNGGTEITLATCNDKSSARLILWARAE